jgi:hypothetical protein
MIALVPSAEDLDRLALVNGEPRDELHLTLWYLGDAVNFSQADIDHCPTKVGEVLAAYFTAWEDPPTILGNAFGAAHWNPTSEDPAWVLNVGDANGDNRLAELRNVIAQTWGEMDWEPPRQHTPWQPHICLAYTSDDISSELESRLGPVSFDRVRVAFGNEITDVPLAAPVTVVAALGGVTVPWHVAHNHSGCPAGKPWAVVKDGTSDVAGCHASQSDANDQLAALYANEGDSTVTNAVTTAEQAVSPDVTPIAAGDVSASGCGADQHLMPDGSCMSNDEFTTESRWIGVLCVEGVTTGDGREFSQNSLTWADHALLRWQKEGSHGGNHDVTVSVGRIDEVWRDGSMIYGRGVLNIKEPDGWTIYNRLKNGFAGGISIDADDIMDADVEVVWAEDDPEDTVVDEDDIVKFLFGRPEKMIYHAGRVRAATLCDIPAFVEAHIALETVDPAAVTASDTRELSAVVPIHSTEISDGPWQPPRTVGALRSLPSEAFTSNYSTGGVLLHHELGEDGELGPANVTAVAAALAQLTSRRNVVPDVDVRAAYEHLAAHLRDAGQEPPPLPETNDALIAAAVVDEWRPPASWFANPNLSQHTGITVTDQGRVYGHIAPWGECHVGFTDECVSPPYEDNHPYFLTGELTCADGSRIAVGQITVGTGHAPLYYQASRAAEHYDNTGCAVVDVTIGNDAHGIWCAGAIRPSVAAARVHELRASGRVSGDWRRIGGQLRLVGVLAVNVPGFPIPRLRARVASGVPQTLVAAGMHLVLGRTVTVEEPNDADLDRDAMRRVMQILTRRVHTSEPLNTGS